MLVDVFGAKSRRERERRAPPDHVIERAGKTKTSAATPGKKDRDTEGHRDTHYRMGKETGKRTDNVHALTITFRNCY